MSCAVCVTGRESRLERRTVGAGKRADSPPPLEPEFLFDPLEPVEDGLEDVAADHHFVSVEKPFGRAVRQLGDLVEVVPGHSVAFVFHDGVAVDVECLGHLLLGEAGLLAGLFDAGADGGVVELGHGDRSYAPVRGLSATNMCAHTLHNADVQSRVSCANVQRQGR